MDTDRELAEVLRIARLASERVSAVYATPFTVELKGPGDPVTRADREANEIICRALEASFPGDAILAEESVPTSADEIARLVAKERVWYVDPLDGTREFADRNGEFCVMVGLAVGGRALLGVLVMPVNGEALAGRVGAAAFREDADGKRAPLRVNDTHDPRAATIVISRSHRPAIVDPVVERLGIARVVPCGSVGVKVARICGGMADLYVHGGSGAKRWDTCAPEAVLVAAGGRFTDLSGRSIDYACPDLPVRHGIVATNGALHDAVIAVTHAA
ncbi:3'(2'),5'-bisphosphate nucleotidase [Minicystis rosea]|nr:3'(2'),5'-bisphosphate nucleotidase [Minicystis rosea]